VDSRGASVCDGVAGALEVAEGAETVDCRCRDSPRWACQGKPGRWQVGVTGLKGAESFGSPVEYSDEPESSARVVLGASTGVSDRGSPEPDGDEDGRPYDGTTSGPGSSLAGATGAAADRTPAALAALAAATTPGRTA